jgi:hypothetical protein
MRQRARPDLWEAREGNRPGRPGRSIGLNRMEALRATMRWLRRPSQLNAMLSGPCALLWSPETPRLRTTRSATASGILLWQPWVA